MQTKTPKTKTAANPRAKAKTVKPAAAKTVKKSSKPKPKLLPLAAPELELPVAPPEMQIPAAKTGRAGRKKYPIIGVALIFSLLCISIVYYCIWLANMELADFAAEKTREVVRHEVPAFAVPKIVSDDQLLAGDYQLSRAAWAPDSSRFVVSQVDQYLEYGLPEKVSSYLYDPESNKLIALAEKADSLEAAPAPDWIDKNYVGLGGNIFDLTDLTAITSTPAPAENISGFELVKTFTAADPETKKTVSTILSQALSPDGDYLAIISEADGPVLTIIPLGAASVEALINFGRVKALAESAYQLRWSADSRYVFVNDDEVADVKSNLVVLTFLGSSDYAGLNRRLIASPDDSQLLLIDYFQDSADANKTMIRIYFKDPAGGEEKDIISPVAYDMVNAIMPYRESGGFTPDRKYAVFYYDSRLWLADAATGKKEPISAVGHDYYDLRLSPDGNKILYLMPGKEVRMLKFQW